MQYVFSDEQEELRASVRRLLSERSHPRAAYDGGPAIDRDLWGALAAAGIAGLGIAESDGGSGGDLLDQVVVAEELGRAVASVPFLATTVLGAGIISTLGSPAQRSSLSAPAAAGELLLALALTGPGTGTSPDAVHLTGGKLTGRLPLVIEAAAADVVLVPVEEAGGTSLFAVHVEADAVTLIDLPTLDRTRRLADVVLDGAVGELVGAPGAADAALGGARRAAQVILAADATGAAAFALEISAEYAKARRQFGRPIGMFQAVKHMAADMLVAVENARSATYFGAWEVAAGGADADLAAAVAKGTATAHAVEVVGDAIQIHGGIAITWEHDLHLYLRRTKTDEQLLGDPAEHLERVAAHVLDT